MLVTIMMLKAAAVLLISLLLGVLLWMFIHFNSVFTVLLVLKACRRALSSFLLFFISLLCH